MKDESNIGFSVVASVILAGLLFQVANAIELRVVMPRLLELCVCYWVLSSPARVGIIFAFSVGILISLIEGSIVGAASMGLSLLAYVLLNNIYTIRQLDWISQTTVIFLLLGISVALQRVVLAAVGVPSDGLGYLVAVVISALLWRPFNMLIDTARFRIGQLLRLILASASPGGANFCVCWYPLSSVKPPILTRQCSATSSLLTTSVACLRKKRLGSGCRVVWCSVPIRRLCVMVACCKTRSFADAEGMLRSLSGLTHEVMTSVTLMSDVVVTTELITTRVEFAELSSELIAQYLSTDEPWDKAGAYGIQGLAGSFVKRLEGSYSGVVGLPLTETRTC